MGGIISTSDRTGQGQQAGTEEQRTDLLRNIDAELTELARALGASRTFSGANPELAALEQKAGDLDAIRVQVVTTRTPGLLSQLKAQAADSIRHIGEALQAAQTTLVGGSGFIGRQIAEAAYHARLTAIENNMQAIMRRDATGFFDADAFARRHGIDGSEFTGARNGLLDVGDRYRREGDRVGGLVTDALISGNTADYWQRIADETGSEEARRKAEEHRRLAERAEKEAHDAVRAEVEKEAEARGMTFATPEEREAWLEEEAKRRHQAKKEEAIDAAVATGKMSAERGEEMKKDIAAAALSGQLADSEQVWREGRGDSAPASTTAVSAPTSVDADAQKRLASASQFSLGVNDAALRAATDAAVTVAQDTANSHAPVAERVTPGHTPGSDPAGTTRNVTVI